VQKLCTAALAEEEPVRTVSWTSANAALGLK